MILCVGPNLALDRTVVVDSLRVGELNRADDSVSQAGGKAANVARTLGELKVPGRLLGVIGGGTGVEVAQLAGEEGLAALWVESSVHSRVCLTVVQPGGVVTDINETGRIDPDAWASFLKLLSEQVSAASAVLVSGSFPKVDGTDLVRGVLDAVTAKVPLWVDTSGSELLRFLDADRHIDMVKVNRFEAEGILALGGNELPPIDAGKALAQVMAERTGGAVIITLGGDGAVACHGDEVLHGVVQVPDVLNPTGSGDAFFGGLAAGLLERDLALSGGLSLALACGASNAQQLPAGQPVAADVAVIERNVKIATI